AAIAHPIVLRDAELGQALTRKVNERPIRRANDRAAIWWAAHRGLVSEIQFKRPTQMPNERLERGYRAEPQYLNKLRRGFVLHILYQLVERLADVRESYPLTVLSK